MNETNIKNYYLQGEAARFGSPIWMKLGGESVFTEILRFSFTEPSHRPYVQRYSPLL